MRVNIVTPGVGTVHATYDDDWTTGATTYTVTAPRVTGVFVISAEVERLGQLNPDPDTPYARVALGRSRHRYYTNPYDREDRPSINGVRLIGDTVIDTEKMRARRLGRYDMSVRRAIDRYCSTSAPKRTQERAAAVVGALLTHWLTRPDNLALRLAAARHAAGNVQRALADKITKQREHIADARRELQQLKDQAAAAAILAAMPPAAPTTEHAPPLH